jgi:hypothetical protein
MATTTTDSFVGDWAKAETQANAIKIKDKRAIFFI